MTRRTPSGLDVFRGRQEIIEALGRRHDELIASAPRGLSDRLNAATVTRLVPRYSDARLSATLVAQEPAGPIVEVRLRGDEVLTLFGDKTLVAPLAPADRAAVAAVLSSALAATLNALATDLTAAAEPPTAA